ncbi:MAG TPA: efflux RND transporter periplasmic adaptor subunit [Opitutaceae bacterium]|jgi:HlyD family secretion protein|nr:efflux RND transporter periplasmic adaptor subunit [Opitutaceae bacterium]
MTVPAARPKGSSKWITISVVAGVLVLIVVGGVLAHRRASGRGQAVTVEKAQVRNITQLVTATGKIQPEVEVKISPEVYGEIIELPFEEGMKVHKGDLIVRIKPDLYAAQVEQQTAAVAAARGNAQDAKAKMEKAAADLRRYQDLHEHNLASDSDYVSYQTAFASAQAEYVTAQANVAEAEGLLNQAKDSLSKTRIYAPMDGTVSSRSCEVGERVVATGEFTGTEIMRVADLSHMEAQVNVNENDLPEVKVGDHVAIAIDAYPDRKFNGIVREIASSAENSGGSGSGSSSQNSGTSADEVTNYLVKIRVVDHDVQLRPGMSATADIETATATGVVAVPIQSVTERDAQGLSSDEERDKAAAELKRDTGSDLTVADQDREARRRRDERRRVVFIKVGDHVRLQPVVTGIADNTWIEVKQGVKPGEQVVSGTYVAISRKLKDGMKVYIEPAPKPSEPSS